MASLPGFVPCLLAVPPQPLHSAFTPAGQTEDWLERVCTRRRYRLWDVGSLSVS
jgi:hypothetical protein